MQAASAKELCLTKESFKENSKRERRREKKNAAEAVKILTMALASEYHFSLWISFLNPQQTSVLALYMLTSV